MQSINCFIIDDEPSIHLLSNLLGENSRLKLGGYAINLLAALGLLLSASNPDVLFINIDLILDFDSNLREYILNHEILVVVTSAYKENAFHAFELGCFDFLLRPLSSERILKTVGRVINRKKWAKESDCFYIQCDTKGKIIKVLYEEIKYVEANQNYIVINTDNNKYTTYQTMKGFEKKLPAHFIRIHKSFIVNERKICSVNNDCVYLKDKTILKIGPNYRASLLNKLLVRY
ncbi:LytTR family DNA-binding domain-containing protein [Pedobacter sp.]|jgi:DNA-binding LytR/AlgR family response regulator|uniref:LytR/AlgR family response regulator transcription factor n=1 Tax=Pedobacter sp. TaxID=1411316 RepID=UPI002BF4C081|nr:LytTR family DNA-binding domain-containing protein [Pedobacter sp.]HWW39810.1 LytTR family DNA-binding domain-containing protein [Pedobacter sp.]